MYTWARRAIVSALFLLAGGGAAACGDGGGSALQDTSTAGDTAASDAANVLGGCAEDALSACEYPSRGLAFAVREGYSVVDDATGRSLPLLARVPAGAGPFPVVIWSHGGGFNDSGHHLSVNWGETLAAHGFVVIHIGHASLTSETGQTVCTLAGIPTAECVPGDDEDANGLLAVVRSYDIEAVIGKLAALSAWSADNGGPALDLDRVVVAGWSGGSRGPAVLMGAKVDPTAGAPRFANPVARVRAAILMSPTGPGFGGFYDEAAATSWDTMRGPVLFATGQNDVKPLKPELDGPTRRFPYDASPSDGARWLLYSTLPVGVGGHGTFDLADLDSADARVARLSRAVRATALAFLDAHLEDDADAQAWLASDNARVLAGEAEWLHR